MAHFDLSEGIAICCGVPLSLNSLDAEAGVEFGYLDEARGSVVAGMDGKVGVRTINPSKLGYARFGINRESSDGRMLLGLYISKTPLTYIFRNSSQTIDLSSITSGVFVKFGEKHYKNNNGKTIYMPVEIHGDYTFAI